MSLYIIQTEPIPGDADMYLDNNHKYMQLHVQYPYIAKSPESNDPFMEPQSKLCRHIAVVHYSENTYFETQIQTYLCLSISL